VEDGVGHLRGSPPRAVQASARTTEQR
jgi:hypothetical protein